MWFALAPAAFMLAGTGTALLLNFNNFRRQYTALPQPATLVNMCIAAVLFMLGALVVFEALRVWRKTRVAAIAGFSVIEPKPGI